ncbi:lanthionine synthetase LanC family protein [Janthinobacterium sp. NFX145]|uniref:lanthionine synthetase LanC family protein n=1 Tax=Janthinobacterium sp. NFX145 TaxID=3415602 RepID=UPI003CC59A3B
MEDRLMDAAFRAPDNILLTNGFASLLVMQARLYQIFPSDLRVERARQLTFAIVDGLVRCPMQIGLWTGLTGVLYALEYARSVSSELLGDKSDAIAELVFETDTTLINFLRQSATDKHFDLISGICGIGAYALMRTDPAAATHIFSAVENSLLQCAERVNLSCTWRTRAPYIYIGNIEERRRERYDLGVAHGIPGIIGLLSHAKRLGLATPETSEILTDSISWLQKKEESGLRYSNFQSMISVSDPPFNPRGTRLAWCYGDLGVAAMLAVSDEEYSDRTQQKWWRRLVESRLAQPEVSFQLNTTGLCHGSAGVLHILRGLLAQGWHCPDVEVLATRLENELTQAVNALNGIPSHCLLEGWTGSLLALVESVVQDRHPGRPWNLCLLTPA